MCLDLARSSGKCLMTPQHSPTSDWGSAAHPCRAPGCPYSQCGSQALLTSLDTAGLRGLSPGTWMRTERARRLHPQPAHDRAEQPVNSSSGPFNVNTSHILSIEGIKSSPRGWLVAQSRREPWTFPVFFPEAKKKKDCEQGVF